MSTLKIVEYLASLGYTKFEVISENEDICILIHGGKFSFLEQRVLNILVNNLFVNQNIVIKRILFKKISLWNAYITGRRDVL